MTAPSPSELPPPRKTAVAIVGTDLVLAAFPATPVQIAHALHRIGYDVVVPASWGDELLAAAALARLEERGGMPAVFCACPRVAERLLATGSELAPVLLPLVVPAVAAARYVRAAYAGTPVSVTYFGGCCATADDSIDARITPREFLRMLLDRDIVPGEMPRVFEGVIPPDRRRHLSLPGGLPDAAQLAALPVPRELACLTSADYAAELAQLVLAREPVLIDVAARLGCACVGATSSTPFERAHETVTRLEPPRAAHPVVDASLAGSLDAELPAPPPRVERHADRAIDARPHPATSHTPTPPRGVPAAGSTGPRHVQHTPPSQSRFASGEPATGPARRRGAVTGFFRGVSSAEQQPRARTGEGVALPRAYVAKRRNAGDGSARTSGEREAARTSGERELAISRHVEPTPTPPAMPAFAPPAVSPLVGSASASAGAMEPLLPQAIPAVAATQRATAAVARSVATPLPVEVPAANGESATREDAPRTSAPMSTRAATEAKVEAKVDAKLDARLDTTLEARPLPSPLPSPVSATRTASFAEPPTRAVIPPALRTPAANATAPEGRYVFGDGPTGRPVPVPPPTSSSGRELLFFVIGAVLAGIAFALFR